jgi:hypothetical protein
MKNALATAAAEGRVQRQIGKAIFEKSAGQLLGKQG